MSDFFNLAIFSSSDFVLPIIQSVKAAEGKTLLDLFESFNQQSSEITQKNFPNYSSKLSFKEWFLESFNLNNDIFLLDIFNKPIQLSFLVSQPNRLNRSKIIVNPVVNYAQINNLNLFTPQKINKEYLNFEDKIIATDCILVASFGQIISQKILDLPKFGIINWHPSNLPQYRGATPMQSCLRDGLSSTALSWIEMEKGMDSGPILLQTDYQIQDDETIFELTKNMGNLGSNLWFLAVILQVLHKKNLYYPKIQNPKDVTFCNQLNKEDSMVDAKNMSADQIYNHWKAYRIFPGTTLSTNLFGKFKVNYCKLYNSNSFLQQVCFEDENWLQIKVDQNLNQKISLLKCANQSYLQVLEITLESGKRLKFEGYQFGKTA